MKPTTELNVLILGGTGNGKSTLINLFANAVLYADLETAEKSTLQIPIPVCYRTHGIDIKAGLNDHNERYDTAGSRTFKPKVYEWTNGDILLRLIDTPGMDDTSGFTKDEEHIANILSCVSRFSTIDGILLVLKSSENRLTLGLKNQLTRILSCFDQSAALCTRWVLTHAGCGGSVGEAQDVVQRFFHRLDGRVQLNKENTFRFENGSLHYLVCVQNSNVQYDDAERAVYAETYSNAVKEYKRLLGTLLANKTHRYLVSQIHHQVRYFDPILAEICQGLNKNLTLLYKQVKVVEDRVQSLSYEIFDSMENLNEYNIVVEYVEVPKQRTVIVEEEYEEDDIVYDDVKEEVTRYRTENQEEKYTEQVPHTVYVPRRVRVTKSRMVTKQVLVNVQKDEVQCYSSDDDSGVPGGAVLGAAVGTALLGPFGLLFGSMAGGAAGRRRVQNRRIVTRTVPEWQNRDEVEYYSDYETRSESQVQYRTVTRTRTVPREVSYTETVTKKVPRTVKVTKTRAVPKIEQFTELKEREKVVRVVNTEVQKTVNRLKEVKTSEERNLENLRKKCELLENETMQVLKLKRLTSGHMREQAFVYLQDDRSNEILNGVIQLKEVRKSAISEEKLWIKLKELCHLQVVGEQVLKAIEIFKQYNSSTFETVEMQWGYLFDDVFQ